MIVGTAGHIDHGKTTLVRALTGVDTDRLPEEKKRGISIELGYAFLDTPGGGRIGFIDVPGHERLVHTMLAGATGIDYVLLLVAADDGVMPQTREHLAIVSLLGLSRGAVVVTKVDRADADRVRSVCTEVAALVAQTPLAGAPVHTVSAPTGLGLEALKARLEAEAVRSGRQAADGVSFRLAVDRAFTLEGVGTVATGTVHGGSVAVDDELVLVPGGTSVRVRSLHAQNQPVGSAHAGQRCAVALAGIPRERIARGDWLVAPAAAIESNRIDAELHLWIEERHKLASGTPVHVHLGAAAVPGRVAVLDGDTLAPGGRARVQLVLDRAIGAWHGDSVILRDASASRTIAGGTVLDPVAPVRYRRTPQRLCELDALAEPDPLARLAAVVAAAPYGVDLRRFAAAQGRAVAVDVPGALRQSDAHGDHALGSAYVASARQAVLLALAAFHGKVPDELGPDSARLRRLAVPRLPEPLWRGLLGGLQRDGAVSVRGALVHLPEHGLRLSAADQRIAQTVTVPIAEAGFEGAWLRDIARDTGEPEMLLRITLSRLARTGDLHQVVKDLYYLPSTMSELARIARGVAAGTGGQVTAAAFRDATRLGRKRAIHILEYFDRVGLFRRTGDVHQLRADCKMFVDNPGG